MKLIAPWRPLLKQRQINHVAKLVYVLRKRRGPIEYALILDEFLVFNIKVTCGLRSA